MTTGYAYSSNEECSITVSGYCEVEVNRFSLESGYDYLVIGPYKHTGTISDLDVRVLCSGTQATFSTDESNNRDGFDICCAESSSSIGSSGSGEIVLTGGNYKTGNVLLNGQPICDDYWGQSEARVVCRSLGYVDGEATTNSYFGSVVDNFIMDNVICNGYETNIWLCEYSPWDDCGVSEGAGVRCFDEEDYNVDCEGPFDEEDYNDDYEGSFDEWVYSDHYEWPLSVVETIVIGLTIGFLCLMMVICCWRCKSSPRQNQNNPGIVHIKRHGDTEEYAFDGSREVERVSNNLPNESGGATTSTRVAYGAETMGYQRRANNFQSGERTTFESRANAQVGERPGEIEMLASPSVVISGNDEINPDMGIYVSSENELNYAAAPVSSDPPAWSAPPEYAPPAYSPPTY